MMDRIRAFFSVQNLPKIALLAGVYLLGRMEGEGRFRWGDVLGDVVDVARAAADSARGIVGM